MEDIRVAFNKFAIDDPSVSVAVKPEIDLPDAKDLMALLDKRLGFKLDLPFTDKSVDIPGVATLLGGAVAIPAGLGAAREIGSQAVKLPSELIKMILSGAGSAVKGVASTAGAGIKSLLGSRKEEPKVSQSFLTSLVEKMHGLRGKHASLICYKNKLINSSTGIVKMGDMGLSTMLMSLPLSFMGYRLMGGLMNKFQNWRTKKDMRSQMSDPNFLPILQRSNLLKSGRPLTMLAGGLLGKQLASRFSDDPITKLIGAGFGAFMGHRLPETYSNIATSNMQLKPFQAAALKNPQGLNNLQMRM